ncbi:carboxypeptidase-like regulatory domain-containing protein [Flavobacterium humi]|uniref:Carboxypeptidase-like regulatory domain-containing protein n=1 Tax=Flavobacterium humi TaxID=2562683 RepID=A0A4Z0LAT4_9FLAO|nr:carboxypeptidase-like regulatory domain-containing protein [Flavobacterium humi]TGD58873.1 carboxypeptidase-like regulatory domain-containing protein [Flavobacterium humi]
MRYFAVTFFVLLSFSAFSQQTTVRGTVVNDNTLLPLWNINIVNVNLVRGAITDAKGNFEIEANVNDILLISSLGFQSIEIKVTNDWIKNKSSRIHLTEKAYALEEVVIPPYDLTGYLEVDSKLIPEKENYWYSISGLSKRYEGGENSPNAFSRVVGSLFNPADMLYNFFGKKPKELRKLKELKKDDKLMSLLQTKYDRETIYLLLGIDKKDLAEILERCSYSDTFAQTANDLQILEAISGCYEEYKILKKK